MTKEQVAEARERQLKRLEKAAQTCANAQLPEYEAIEELILSLLVDAETAART